ncbi:ankyrin repeat protein [Klosneuvirus KNV1]|uniref:Ankyrin repeat protein n=1 Tax=Klosneuvirus KNV1 TaxID=1977640 RepID=A0A1V0SKR1_9VIRU|nr:ankyrin repeat protein [Klosneuvirus KNV1]
MEQYKYIKLKFLIGGMDIQFDDNDLFENDDMTVINLSKADTTTWLNIDPYKISIYNISTLKKAIKLGYNVNKQNKNGVTLLHCYARKNPSKSVMNSVKLLLEHGANPLILTHKQISVVDIAMKYNQPMAKLLITKYHVPAINAYKQILKITS